MNRWTKDDYKLLARYNRLVAKQARLNGDEEKAKAFDWLAEQQERMG